MGPRGFELRSRFVKCDEMNSACNSYEEMTDIDYQTSPSLPGIVVSNSLRCGSRKAFNKRALGLNRRALKLGARAGFEPAPFRLRARPVFVSRVSDT